MIKQKTSVVFLDANGNSDRKIQIPTFVVKNWKRIVVLGIFVICLACSTIVYLATKNTSDRYEKELTKKIEALEAAKKSLASEEASNQMSMEQLQKSFDAIDSTINQINAKMRKRGLKDIAPKIKNVGGPVEEEVDIEELTKFYKKELKNLDKKLEGIPLGIPHHGKITSRFGYRRNPFTNKGREMHSGIDIKGRIGEPIKATAAGKVTFAGYKGQYGRVVIVEHSNGWETRYAHLSGARVRSGQRVDAGQIIGTLGSTGRSTGPHLHYELLSYGRKLNPEKTLRF
ncbi:M23 family metallopeptidase [Sphingobacterium humi]|uniref:Peptidoglycan DD-metalloendopeptidase family protein n=1 Tax=Sphingobacterium humi TaxID=1796905 RepID=A0A6N8L2E5_9SPHI|nr:M23 family metallopeptidase [Sphingobacterium humi]MVZ63467.1 peptidoglycan DD-metalloendopeptidase family protein [Sphingobacterium humi]